MPIRGLRSARSTLLDRPVHLGPDRAEDFYGRILGWTAEHTGEESVAT